MAKIECPICEEDVRSADAIGLGDSFKRHLMDVHRMVGLACIDMNAGVEPAKEVATYEVRREVTVERPVGMEGTSGVGRAGEERASGVGRLETKGAEVMRDTGGRVRDVAGTTRSEREVEVTRRVSDVPGVEGSGKVVGVSTPRQELESVRRTAPEFVIKCPFCNDVLRADDDDDLGDDLKDHWGDVHQIRPTIRAELGMSRAR